MAINKTKTLNNGVTITHHRIYRTPVIQNIPQSQMVEVFCEEYLSKSDKDSGRTPVSSCSYQVEISKSEIEGISIFSVAYSKLMALPEFVDAIEE